MRLSLIFSLIILQVSSFAQHVNFEPALSIALKKARAQNKPLFIEYYNSECSVCQKLEPVFLNDTLARYYNEHFVSYKLNTEKEKKEDSLFIARAGLHFEDVPNFLFFDSNGKFIHYSGTKPEIHYLINAATTALDPNERSSSLAQKYNSGDRSIKTLYAYSNLLKLYKNTALRKTIANELYAVYPKEELGTQKSYIITKNCVDDIDNGFFKYWIVHIEEMKQYEKNSKTLHVTNVLADILQKAINENRNKWDAATIRQVKVWIVETELGKDPDAFFPIQGK